MKLGTLVYIKDKENRVLMLCRNKKVNDCHEGLWLAPGGKIEFNESPIAGAVREVKEETGLTISNPELRGILVFPEDGTSPFGDLWYVFLFRVTNNFSGELIDSPEGTLKWIPVNQLNDLPMWEGDKIFTPLIFNDGSIFQCEFLYHYDKLIKYNISYM